MKIGERVGWAVALGVTISVAVYPLVFSPTPYSDVTLMDFKKESDGYYVQASFIKHDCVREDVVFVGYRIGIPEKLKWKPLDGYDYEEDRIEGFQVLTGIIVTNDIPYEALEIRTRHYCGSERIDKVFLHVTLLEDGGLNNAAS